MAGVKYGSYLNIDKYRNEFDTDEQWRVKRNFMLTYMHEFTEDRLVCLAQVLFNVKYLGCTYPEKTMDLVERLSTSVKKFDPAVDGSKLRLKRTLVQAQTAASAKVQRLSYIDIAEKSVASSAKVNSTCPPPAQCEQLATVIKQEPATVSNSACPPPAQCQQLATVTKQEPATVSKPSASEEPLPLSKSILQGVPYDNINVQLLKNMQAIKGPIKALVLIEISNDDSHRTFQRNANLWKRPFQVTSKQMGRDIWSTVQFDGLLLSDLRGKGNLAKKVACKLAMYKLQTLYYTIRMERASLVEDYFKFRYKKISKRKPIFHPSNKLEAVGSLEDYKKILFFAKIEGAEKYDETNGNDRAVIMTKLKNFIDDYDSNLEERRDMVFVPQYDFDVYRELFELASAPGIPGIRRRQCKFIGRVKNQRALVVYRHSEYVGKLPWRMIHGIFFDCKDDIKDFKIIPPGTVPMPDLEGMIVGQSPQIWCPPK